MQQDAHSGTASPGGFLIVDDVAINIYVTEEMLLPYNAPIDTAASGTEAVEKIKNGNVYDIIFMDHMMPDLNGVEATKIIRSMGYTGCIIALTAHSTGENDRLYLDSGFNNYITKPIDEDILDDLINSFVDLDKYEDDAYMAETSDDAYSPEVDDLFLMDAEAAIKVLDEMFSASHTMTEEELETFEITIHGIKSALINIGEKTLSVLAYELEQAARYGDYEIVVEDAPEFISQLKEYARTKRHS